MRSQKINISLGALSGELAEVSDAELEVVVGGMERGPMSEPTVWKCRIVAGSGDVNKPDFIAP
ncbi:hypothetical protein [Streptosporangium carneum]|uniref:Uncharacterized protein n=1 Tax=Streptosporangium carneum TaxID=47481 RepID=A0A9W6I3Y8_9ACTN|nr:hypothetical protein [Streptosporangium carneum]GLK11611.1 hypothetical protein GCM10017600_50180 [Streptosporangium carneum]